MRLIPCSPQVAPPLMRSMYSRGGTFPAFAMWALSRLPTAYLSFPRPILILRFILLRLTRVLMMLATSYQGWVMQEIDSLALFNQLNLLEDALTETKYEEGSR